MKYIPTFESFLYEGKMVIHPAMDKTVKTPWGKGGPRSTVILGKTSSGLDVTLNGDFVDAKAGRYVTEPTDEDRKEAKEMVQFHHDRLTGGINKEKLAAVLHMFESFLNEGNKFSAADEVELRQWLTDELGIKPFHIENYVFMHNGKSRKGEIMAMWKNKKDHADLKDYILSVIVPSTNILSYVKQTT